MVFLKKIILDKRMICTFFYFCQNSPCVLSKANTNIMIAQILTVVIYGMLFDSSSFAFHVEMPEFKNSLSF